jgi:hypothetical protein
MAQFSPRLVFIVEKRPARRLHHWAIANRDTLARKPFHHPRWDVETVSYSLAPMCAEGNVKGRTSVAWAVIVPVIQRYRDWESVPAESFGSQLTWTGSN